MGSHFSTSGYFDVNCPTTGTITGVGGHADVTAMKDYIKSTGWLLLFLRQRSNGVGYSPLIKEKVFYLLDNILYSVINI
jgi:hypothetical protein